MENFTILEKEKISSEATRIKYQFNKGNETFVSTFDHYDDNEVYLMSSYQREKKPFTHTYFTEKEREEVIEHIKHLPEYRMRHLFNPIYFNIKRC